MQRRANRFSTSANGSNASTKHSHQRNAQIDTSILRPCLILTPLIALLCLWIYATLYVLSATDVDTSISSRLGRNRTKHINRLIDVIRSRRGANASIPAQSSPMIKQAFKIQEHTIISRNSTVAITSSTRGNLGPPTVLNQDPPGNDWIKDRWQAASDMGGTAIPGTHWILLDFSSLYPNSDQAAYVTKVVLDWETAFAYDYRIESRIDIPTSIGGEQDEWCVMYDGASDDNDERNNVQKNIRGIGYQYTRKTVKEYGQSPGVKQKLPLHIIHTIEWGTSVGISKVEISKVDNKCHLMRYLRIFIRKPARGWGVSLWQVDVYGFDTKIHHGLT
ncbi:hypothetical protein ACHAW6_007920 [Cyclotella cf. meneghiniana]